MVPGSLWKPTSRKVKGQACLGISPTLPARPRMPGRSAQLWQSPLLPVRGAQHLLADEENPWNQACGTVLKGSKSRQNMKLGNWERSFECSQAGNGRTGCSAGLPSSRGPG